MKLIWNGHACFTLEAEGSRVVVDPYRDGSIPGHGPLKLHADAVFCSHGHHDHDAVGNVILSGRESKIGVEELHTFHDGEQGRARGKNVIRIFSAEGMRVAHLGDLGCVPEPEQMERLKGLDAMLLPVGGFFTIDAVQAKALVEALAPRVVIPMHYRVPGRGFDVIATVEPFLALCDNVVRYDGNVLELTKETPAQTALLTDL